MITFREIKKALADLLKSKYPQYKVHFDNVEKSSAPYFYVEFMPSASTVDPDYTDRLIQIDITYVHSKDRCGRINRTEVLDMADVLDRLIRPVLAIKDRRITILDSEITVVDDVLHYIFTLDFTDGMLDESPDGAVVKNGRDEDLSLMQRLGLHLNKQDYTEIEEEEEHAE